MKNAICQFALISPVYDSDPFPLEQEIAYVNFLCFFFSPSLQKL